LPYIHRIKVKNFKSIGDIQFTLDPITILVGPNGTGKSNILDVFNFARDALNLGLEQAVLQRGGAAAIRRWSSKGRPNDISISFEIRQRSSMKGKQTEIDTIVYSFQLGGKRKTELKVKSEKLIAFKNEQRILEIQRSRTELKFFYVKHIDSLISSIKLGQSGLPVSDDELFLYKNHSLFFTLHAKGKLNAKAERLLIKSLMDISSLLSIFGKMSFYNIYPNVIKQPQKPGHERYLNDDASNFASVLRRLISRHPNWKKNVVSYLNAASPHIADIQVHQVGQFLVTKIYRSLTGDTKAAFDLSQESDGTLRMLALLTALLQEPHRALIGIEEPEIYIHPAALAILKDAINESQMHSQIIITTHSPQMLDHFQPESFRIVKKNKGWTEISTIPNYQIETIKEGLINASELFVAHSFSPDEL